MEKICNTCAMYIAQQMRCARTQAPELSTNSCGHWCESVPTCSVCGRLYTPPATYINIDEEYVSVCPACFEARNTCGSCKASVRCDFQENPIAIPPMIMKTARRGNQVMSAQVPNPDRITATCVASGCKCYHKDDEHEWCCRQFGCCGNYEMKEININKGE